MASERRTLYDPVDPFDSGWLDVGNGHQIHYEQCGNPDGKPAVFLHGGPGGGFEAKHRGYFDPRAYRIVLLDQRGAGKSRPFAGLEHNTTWDLVADLERLREHCGVESWLVFGGSWGSTLALAYAQTHPGRVTELVLRGIFLGTRREVAWLYDPDGAARFYPDRYQGFLAPIPVAERGDLLEAYRKRLFGPASEERTACAVAWSLWEGGACRLVPDLEELEMFSDPDLAVALARIECHYFVHDCFLEDGQLLRDMGKVARTPGVIVQGRYDMVCPPAAAWDLHQAWPAGELIWVPDGGHSASEPGITDALVRATDGFRE